MNKNGSMSDNKEMLSVFIADNTTKAASRESIGKTICQANSKQSRIQNPEHKKIMSMSKCTKV